MAIVSNGMKKVRPKVRVNNLLYIQIKLCILLVSLQDDFPLISCICAGINKVSQKLVGLRYMRRSISLLYC